MWVVSSLRSAPSDLHPPRRAERSPPRRAAAAAAGSAPVRCRRCANVAPWDVLVGEKTWVHRGKCWFHQQKWWFHQQKWWFHQRKWWFHQQNWWFKKQTWWFNKQKSDFTSKSDASSSKKMNFADQNGGEFTGIWWGSRRCKPAIFGGDIMGM